MTLKEQLELRQRQWDAFHCWEEQQPPLERDAGEVLADLSAILDWIPEEDRLRDPDPEKRGVEVLFAAGRILSHGR